MLELYHSINSVCAQKVRIALEEKGRQAKDHIMTLRGDQYEPAYLKLNPNSVVPTLVHDGEPIVESSLILYYIDDAFPEPSLMPKEPYQRHGVRMYNKLINEYVCAQLVHYSDLRHRIPPSLPEDGARGLAGRNQQDPAQAPRGVSGRDRPLSALHRCPARHR